MSQPLKNDNSGPAYKDKTRSSISKTAWMMNNAGALIHTISAISLHPDDTLVSSETGFETLCSYNWLIDGSAIVVPGGPPRWNPISLPITLPRDIGYQYVDRDGFQVPKYPFEPAFRALSAMNPSARLDDIDIVANRNSLRKLLDFSAGRNQDPFRMDLHMIQDTLFISRRERTAKLMIHGAHNSGYGHSFEEVFTTCQTGLDQSSSHHRVVRYRFGRLNCVVRFEVDAFYENEQTQDVSAAAETPIQDVVTSLTDLSVSETQAVNTTEGVTRVIRKGNFTGPTKLAELKAHKEERINRAMPQLWFGRTPYLITGKHTMGTVHSISCTRVEEKFLGWEATNQQTLRKLAGLLMLLKNVVSAMKDRTAIILCRQKGAPLTIFDTKKYVAVLPTDVVEKHWGSGGE